MTRAAIVATLAALLLAHAAHAACYVCPAEPRPLPRLFLPWVQHMPRMSSEYTPAEPVPVVTPEVHLAVIAFGVPTVTPAPTVGPCPCNADLRNCSDFASQYEAQQCYNWCMVQGLGDPNGIDRDADGVACEQN